MKCSRLRRLAPLVGDPSEVPLAKVGGAFFMSVQPRSNVRKKAPHTRASGGAIKRGWLGVAISHVLICSEWPKGTGNYSNRGDKIT